MAYDGHPIGQGLRRTIERTAKDKHLSATDERDLVDRMRAGDAQARNTLIVAHMGVALAIARRRASREDFDDVFCEAMIGVTTAVDRYEAGRGARVGWFAKIYAKGAANAFLLRNASLVRIPDTTKNHRIFRGVTQVFPSTEDDATPNAQQARALARATDVRMDEVTKLWLHSVGSRTLNDKHLELLEDPCPNPETALADNEERASRMRRVRTHVRNLSTKERDILRQRTSSEPPATFREIGRRHETSGERARQIHAIALTKLRKAAAD